MSEQSASLAISLEASAPELVWSPGGVHPQSSLPGRAFQPEPGSAQAELTIGMVQYTCGPPYFLPYAVGLIQASLLRSPRPQRYRFLRPLALMAPLEQDVTALLSADVVGISVSVWNERRSLALARRLKARKPELLIIFGGPQVPDAPEDWLRANPCVDLAVHGEGEDVFLALMEALPERPWESIAGLSWLDRDSYRHTPKGPRRKALDELPSPFLSGVFEPLLEAHPEIDWATTWETNRGCPFTCVFCDWGSATAGRVFRFDEPRLLREFDWFAQQRLSLIYSADANFGMLPRDLELARYAAEVKLRTGYPKKLTVQNAKNVTDRNVAIHSLLSQAGLDRYVTISFQSLHPPTLEASGRKNISLEDFETLQQRLRAAGMKTYTDLIIGLPEESYASFADGISTLVARGQYTGFQIFTASILPNAPMANPDYRARYGLETVTVPMGIHPEFEGPDELTEFADIVIATHAMPRGDWVRTRIFAWLFELVFFRPGILRIPMLSLHSLTGASMRTLVEALMAPGSPTMDWMMRFYQAVAHGIQKGGPEYCPGVNHDGSRRWLDPSEALLDLMVRQNRLNAFYAEAGHRLAPLAAGLPPGVLEDALFLSASFCQLNFRQDPFPLRYHSRWNIWDYHQAMLRAEPIELAREDAIFVKDWAGEPFRLRCLSGAPAS